MFNDAIKEVTGIFDRRFLLNVFCPSLIFWVLMTIIAAVGSRWNLLQVLQSWNQQDAFLKTLQIVICVIFITIFSVILNNQSGAILRFYEGYWNFPLGRKLKYIGQNWHKNNWIKLDFRQKMNDIAQQMKTNSEEINDIQTKLGQISTTLQSSSVLSVQQQERKIQLQEKQADLEKERATLNKAKLEIQQNIKNDEESIYLYYPPLTESEEEVMPTRLGNILKNAEIYPFSRYKLEAVLIWPRLYHLLPERYIQMVAEAKISLDFMLIISTLSGIFAILSGSYLFIVRASGWLFLLCFWGGLFVAWWAYKNALGSALLYAQQIKVAFDLYRHELLKQMRLELPKTLSEEMEIWKNICQLLYSSNTQVLLEYKDSESVKSQNTP
jgi:hypothetical protein